MMNFYKRSCAGLIAAIFASNSIASTYTFTYAAGSRPVTLVEPDGQAHTFSHNGFDEVVSHKLPLGRVEYGYDSQGGVTSITDPRGLVTTYTLDGFGSPIQVTSPDSGVTHATFDAAGNRTGYTDARGNAVTSTFDFDNRLTSVNYGDHAVSFGYDGGNGAGHLTSMQDASGQTSWAYDRLGRVLAKTQVTSSATLAVAYSYFSGGRVASITYPSGTVVGFTYDGANVSSVTVNGATVITGVAYFPFGTPQSWVMGSIGTYSRSADTTGRIASHTTEYGTRTLTWDASSRLTAVAETGRAGRSYEYDALNRLISANEEQAKTFRLDLTGNRTGTTTNGAETGYGIDGSSNRLSSVFGDGLAQTYGYDSAGNITSDGSRLFSYNGAGQLTTVTGSGVLAQYSYNGLGQRVRKVTPSGTHHYLYAEDGVSLLGEYDQTSVVHETVYLEGIPVLVLKGGGAYYVLPDHLGTPRALKNGAGATVWRWNSDAFGKGLADENPSGVFQFTFNQRFPGQQYDAETGLHYNNARYYDPRTGRYITSDPIGLAGGLNTFLYAAGSPLSTIDPSGLDWITVFLFGGQNGSYGHIGYSINNRPPEGYYPGSISDGLQGNLQLALGRRPPGVVKLEHSPATASITFEISPERALAAQLHAEGFVIAPGNYELYSRNCTHVASSVLNAAGVVDVPATMFPKKLMIDLERTNKWHSRTGFGPQAPSWQ